MTTYIQPFYSTLKVENEVSFNRPIKVVVVIRSVPNRKRFVERNHVSMQRSCEHTHTYTHTHTHTHTKR